MSWQGYEAERMMRRRHDEAEAEYRRAVSRWLWPRYLLCWLAALDFWLVAFVVTKVVGTW